MANSDSVDSKEEQEAETSVDNVCYTKIKIPCKSGSGNDVVREAVIMDEGSVDSKEQDVGTSVDNICYEKLQSRLYYAKSQLLKTIVLNLKQCVALTKSSMHTHSLPTNRCGLPAGSAVFRRRTG